MLQKAGCQVPRLPAIGYASSGILVSIGLLHIHLMQQLTRIRDSRSYSTFTGARACAGYLQRWRFIIVTGGHSILCSTTISLPGAARRPILCKIQRLVPSLWVLYLMFR